LTPAPDSTRANVIEPAVRFEGVWYSYPAPAADQSPPPALENVTLDVRQGERLGILGPNGGGKSTLLKITLGLLEPSRGTVRVMGRTPRDARRSGLVGYLAQRCDADVAFPVSARQIVEMAASTRTPMWRGLSRMEREHALACLDLVGASALASRHVGGLSGGQMQRVLLARALASRPRVLLLDEPTVGIDPAGQQQFSELLRRVNRELGVTLIVVSHDLRTVAAGCDRVACLSRTLHCHVAPSGLTPGVLAEVFRHDVSAIFGDVHVDAHSSAECAPLHPHFLPRTPPHTPTGHVEGSR
jgi:zinc transport system ATP-binding protein